MTNVIPIARLIRILMPIFVIACLASPTAAGVDLLDGGEPNSFSPLSAYPGQWITVNCIVRSTSPLCVPGIDDPGGFYVKFYASTNTTISSSDYFLGPGMYHVYPEDMGPCDTEPIMKLVQIPDSIPLGLYYIGWIIDPSDRNDVNEYNEDNNTGYDDDHQLQVVPPNDECINAVSVYALTNYSFSNVGATGSDCLGSRDVWFKYTPSQTGWTIIDTCGSQFDTTLAVHNGSCSGGANCDDDECPTDGMSSSLTLMLNAGTTYYISVGGFGGATGTFALQVCPAATWYRDADIDGYGNPNDSIPACLQPSGYVSNDDDCDDNCSTCHPGGTEVCDNKDNDCDGSVDEGVGQTWYRDADGDGYGNPNSSVTACSQPSGYVSNNQDCDDNCATCHPGGTEVCDGKDNDCDGSADEGVGQTWYRDADGDGYGNPNNSVTACSQPSGYVSNNQDCDDNCATCHPGGTEVCDGKDNDCDGSVDEGVGQTWYRDADGDGYGSPNNPTTACSQPPGYVSNNQDCDDNCASCHPGGTEVCDNKDNDCDGSIDEGVGQTWYRDADGDGYGNPNNSMTACSQPSGYVSNNQDCDDNCASCHPGGTETCDGKDNDCDNQTDEGGVCDGQDSDGDGDPDRTDCNDSDPNIHHGATEVCDNKDNDCDGQTDEEGASGCATYYRDHDNDGYGVSSDYRCLCAQSGEYRAPRGGDCDDNCESCHPGGTETCDGKDNDCDNQTDEGDIGTWWYRDADADGYGNPANKIKRCTNPSGYVSNDDDCNDECAACRPGGTETCDGKDNDCDNQTDEGDVCSQPDADGDGDPDATDCNDSNANIHHGATEICGNGVDEDCSGQDQSCPSTGACCLADQPCQMLTSANCDNAGGSYKGDGSPCTPSPCEGPTGYSIDTFVIGNGRIDKNPDRESYSQGEVVTVTAMPDLGWSFVDWSGDLSGSDNPKQVSVSGDLNVTASFRNDCGNGLCGVGVCGAGGTGLLPLTVIGLRLMRRHTATRWRVRAAA